MFCLLTPALSCRCCWGSACHPVHLPGHPLFPWGHPYFCLFHSWLMHRTLFCKATLMWLHLICLITCKSPGPCGQTHSWQPAATGVRKPSFFFFFLSQSERHPETQHWAAQVTPGDLICHCSTAKVLFLEQEPQTQMISIKNSYSSLCG